MIHLATLNIRGLPAPQGSKTKMPNGALVEAASATGRAAHVAWRGTVAWTARRHAPRQPHDGPLHLYVEFRFPMPKCRSARLRDIGMAPKDTKPDLDKLVRALCDGLKEGGLIRDDARIAEVTASKIETVDWTGATVSLSAIRRARTA